MILSYKPEFQEFLNALATENGNHSDDIAAQILDVWMDKMPCVTQPERRKLLSLGISHISTLSLLGEGRVNDMSQNFPKCPKMSKCLKMSHSVKKKVKKCHKMS